MNEVPLQNEVPLHPTHLEFSRLPASTRALYSAVLLVLGLAYLFISHDLGDVRHIAHDVLVMYLGLVMEQGPKPLIFARPVDQTVLAGSTVTSTFFSSLFALNQKSPGWVGEIQASTTKRIPDSLSHQRIGVIVFSVIVQPILAFIIDSTVGEVSNTHDRCNPAGYVVGFANSFPNNVNRFRGRICVKGIE